MKVKKKFRRCTAEVTIPDELPKSGVLDATSFKVEWSGKGRPKFDEYREWMNGIIAEQATKWNLTIGYAYMTSPTTSEFWKFRPGKPPELHETIT